MMNLGLALRQVGIIAGSGVVIPPPPTLPEAEWLMLHVDKGGAITQTPGDSAIRTYLSLYGALGLVRGYEVTENNTYLGAAWGFAAWYRDHMDATTGYVNDYTTGFSDSFTRANGAVGNGWGTWYGSASISGNKVVSDGVGGAIYRDISSADVDYSADVQVLAGAFRAEMYFNHLAAVGASQTYFFVSITDAGLVTLWRRAVGGGGDTSLGTYSGPAPATLTTVRVLREGSSIKVYYAGALAISATDATVPSGTNVAILVSDTVTIDNVSLPGAYVDSGIKDSTDAYAGMYLTLLWSLHVADPSHSLSAFSASIPLALHAIESTQQIDGLTYALPTYDVKYLEDNVEALYGARCAQSLAYVLASGNTSDTLYVRAKHTADELARGVGIMWDWETHVWDYAIHASGFFARNDWSDDNARRQQMWATGWGEAVNPLESSNLLAAYVAAFPTWATQSSSGNYEPMATWAYRRIGDISGATAAIGIIEDNGVANGRGYPWTCQNSGLMIIGQYGFTAGMSGTGADGNPIPDVTFPLGVNILPNPTFVDSNSDGLPDYVTNYNNPGNSVLPLLAGGNAYQMVIPSADAYAAQWPTFDLSAEGGTWYCFSVYKLTTYLSDPVNSKIVVTWEAHDASDNLITYSYSLWPDVDTDGVFKRIWMSFLVPVGGTPWTKLHLSIGFQNGPGTFILASPKFEKAGASPTPLSGSLPVLLHPPFVRPPLPFTDPFTRADGAVGMPWLTLNDLPSTWVITGNAAYPSTAVPDVNVIDAGTPDVVVSGTVKALPPVNAFLGLVARGTDVSNYYELQLVALSGFGTYLRVLPHAGSADVVWQETQPGDGLTTTVVGDVVSLQVTGTTVTVKRNGGTVGTLTDSTLATGNYAGISASHFAGGTLSGYAGWDSVTVAAG